jgi:hypothetical protein
VQAPRARVQRLWPSPVRRQISAAAAQMFPLAVHTAWQAATDEARASWLRRMVSSCAATGSGGTLVGASQSAEDSGADSSDAPVALTESALMGIEATTGAGAACGAVGAPAPSSVGAPGAVAAGGGGGLGGAARTRH